MNERRWELDIIRIIACAMVVVIHVAGYGMEIMNPETWNWQVRNLVVSMTKCTVPIFFMMSGALFLNREISIKQLYKKYISHILVLWIVWSSFYAVIDYVAYIKNGETSIVFFLERFFLGHYHLWFLPSLLAAYIMYPLLYKMAHTLDKNHILYLGVIVLFGIVFKETLDPLLMSPIWDGIWNDLAVPGGFVGVVYFVLGYYLDKKVDILPARLWIIIYGCAVLVIAGINQGCSLYCKEPLSITYGYLSFGVMISAVAIFSFLIQKIRSVRLKAMQMNIIKEISGCTLGIYLMHTFFIEQVFRRIGLMQENYPVIVSIILFSTLSFGISLLLTWCIRRIPILRKWIV